MVEKIIKVISNLKVLSKMNEIIDGLNTHTTNTNNPHNVTAEQLGLATAYVYKGSVTNFSDLPANAQNGWVYSVENEYIDSSGNVYPAGSNFAWNGSKWDDLGGSLSGYAKSVNSQTPDSKGNVFLNLVKSLEKNTEDKLIVHNADGTTQELELGKNYDKDLNNILDSITELETRVVPIEKGGTGATTVAEARKNLGLESTTEVIPISQGGTGADNASGARTNLGLSTAVTGASIKGNVITLTFADGTTKSLTTQGAAFMPNYGSYVQISTGDYTPTSNGIIIVNHEHSDDHQTVKVVHKSSRLEIFRDSQARYPGDFTSWCLVAKSETYTISVSGGDSTVYFCPMKEM